MLFPNLLIKVHRYCSTVLCLTSTPLLNPRRKKRKDIPSETFSVYVLLQWRYGFILLWPAIFLAICTNNRTVRTHISS